MRARRLPPPLPEGARIGIAALSGPLPRTWIERGKAVLSEAGLVPVEAPNVGLSEDYLAGDDEARRAGIEALLDAGVDAILPIRGGYGAMRLLRSLPWERLRAWGGWFVGLSDLTAVHAAAATRLDVATLHASMLGGIARRPAALAPMLGWMRHRRRVLFRVGREQVVRGGRVQGITVGGNLSILGALAGTPFEPEYDGGVVFLEDVNEPAYRIDRVLTQLALSSRLAGVCAVVAGRFVQCGRGCRAWRARWRELLLETVPPGVVVIEGLPFGHGEPNRPIPLGVAVEVDTVRGSIVLVEG